VGLLGRANAAVDRKFKFRKYHCEFQSKSLPRCEGPDLNNPNSLTNGTRIELWDCWGGPMQAWYRTAAPMPVNCFFFRISGLFLVRYLEMRGSERLGCPAGPEMNHPDGGDGRYQTFDGGAMAYSPNTGPNSVQMGYGGARFLGLLWSTTDPFTYDKFIVRYDRTAKISARTTLPNRQSPITQVRGCGI
jgi:hypothetical protein